MKIGFSLLLFLVTSLAWSAHSSSQVEETLYQEYRQSILNNSDNSLSGFTSFEHSLYADALWDLADENEQSALLALKSLPTVNFDLLTQLRIGILQIITGTSKSLPGTLTDELNSALIAPEPDRAIIYTIAGYEQELLKGGHAPLVELARPHKNFKDISLQGLTDNGTVLKDLFNHRPAREGVTLYMFCRQNRLHPCLMVMRDRQGEVVKNNDGTLWTHQALASSKKGLPAHVRSGNTPAGVHLINSVMPYADAPVSFGKFRRVILEFVPKSGDESRLKTLLPSSSQNQTWWMPSVVARDIGRNLLRIHGTGKINEDPKSSFYPFVRTSGCIAQRENTYDGVTYQDQRDLLDSLMDALDLAPTYDNETEIKGVLYLVEINAKGSAVTEKDLQGIGIL